MTRRALIIESDPSLGRFLERALRRLDWHPVRAAAFDEALDAYETGRYGLVLCELEFDEYGGLVLAKAFRRCEPSLGVVMICDSHDEGAEAMAAGLVHFLIKPFTLRELRDAIFAALSSDFRNVR